MPLSRAWFVEFRALAIVAVFALMFGLYTGFVVVSLLLAAIGYLAYTLYRIHQLSTWAHQGSRDPLIGLSGPLAVVHDRLYRVDRQKRKRKKRLRKAADELRSAAEATPDGTILLGPTYEILWVNQSAETLLGLHENADRFQPLGNLLRSPEFVAYLEEREFSEPLEINSPVDENIRLLIRLVPYGKDRYLFIARNITRLYRLEQMRKDFVANVSHELRSPLTVIVGYLETLCDDPQAPARWARPVEQMSQQAGRMCSIVEDLLRLSRLEADPNNAPMVGMDVVDLLENIRRDAGALGGDQHQIEVIAQSGDTLLGEYSELFSAVANLVFNAVQYTPSGGTISLHWAARSDDTWALSVQDSGIGIDSSHIPRLTERFYRVDKARSRDLGGTGLGLAIVKHVLVRHGAHLEITSELGKGSCFSCVFPASRVTPEGCEATDSAPSDGDSGVETPAHAGERVSPATVSGN